jgi:hypothetical protein
MAKYLWALLLASISIDALCSVENAGIKINGQHPHQINRGACTNPKNPVEIVLNNETLEAFQDLRAYVITLSEKKDAKPKDCDKTLSNSVTPVAEFTKSHPFIDAIFLLGGKSSNACSADGASGVKKLCIYSAPAAGSELVAQVQYTYDTQVATLKKENIREMSAANGIISFNASVSRGTAHKIEVCYGVADGDKINDKECPSPPFNLQTFDLPHVKIEVPDRRQTYSIKVRLPLDGAEATAEGWLRLPDASPVTVAVPLNLYDGPGSEAQYSCTSSPQAGDVLVIVGLLALFIAWRLSRLKLRGSNLFLFLFLPFMIFMRAPESQAEFGQISFSILGSMYRPDLDSPANARNFYKSFFRKKDSKSPEGPINPLIGFNINYHLWDGLRVGLGMAYTYVSGSGLEVDGNDQPLIDKPKEDYSVALHMYQVRPQVTYAMDHFVEYFPLFPYMRAGLIAQGYNFTSSGNGATVFTNSGGQTVKSNGFRFGWFTSLGAMLRINFLEPSSISTARSGNLFENVYLLSELSYEKIDSFGRPGFQFSPKDVMGTSLPLMWTFGLAFDLP